MMNDDTEQFERRLSHQPLRQVPREWRAEILAATESAARPKSHASFLATFNQQLATLFWPHPKAWAGLAAVWILIFAVNFSMRDKSPVLAEKSAPPSPAMIVELKQQQRMYAELIGANETPDADRRKTFMPQPRSECAEILTT